MAHAVIAPDGTRLSVQDLGGRGPASVLCLHGLAGHAGEWAATAERLAGDARVVAFDARGHGDSERFPSDISRGANVADAVAVLEALELAPAAVVGQSLGGQTAILVAAARPDLVRALVVLEATPDSGGGEAYVEVERALRSWPVPFARREDAVAYFRGRGFPAQEWADGLERREDGWWPRFDVDVLVRTLREADRRAYWDEWERIRCPVLVVRGTAGTVLRDHALEVVRRARAARLVEIEGGGHDLHLERPAELAGTLGEFLRSL